MWFYNHLSQHYFTNPPIGSTAIGRNRYFLEQNPQIFFLPSLCPYCESDCQVLAERKWRDTTQNNFDLFEGTAQVYVCQTCGWWTVPITSYHDDKFDDCMYLNAGQVRGELKVFTYEADDVPIEELHRYLLAHYERRNAISPYKVEDAVAQIFRDAGYAVVTTARSNDNGIDLFITQKDDLTQKAVQIKRTKNKIGAEFIRSFAGALLYEGVPNGIFVTTSEYTVNARLTAERFRLECGHKIELVNSSALYDALRLKRRDRYRMADDPTAPFFDVWKNPRKFATSAIDAMDRIEV